MALFACLRRDDSSARCFLWIKGRRMKQCLFCFKRSPREWCNCFWKRTEKSRSCREQGPNSEHLFECSKYLTTLICRIQICKRRVRTVLILNILLPKKTLQTTNKSSHLISIVNIFVMLVSSYLLIPLQGTCHFYDRSVNAMVTNLYPSNTQRIHCSHIIS